MDNPKCLGCKEEIHWVQCLVRHEDTGVEKPVCPVCMLHPEKLPHGFRQVHAQIQSGDFETIDVGQYVSKQKQEWDRAKFVREAVDAVRVMALGPAEEPADTEDTVIAEGAIPPPPPVPETEPAKCESCGKVVTPENGYPFKYSPLRMDGTPRYGCNECKAKYDAMCKEIYNPAFTRSKVEDAVDTVTERARKACADRYAAGEADPTGRKPSDPGAKLDQGKVRMGLVLGGFANALREVCVVGTKGAAKYSDNGWKEVPDGQARYTDALYRHLNKHQAGEVVDPEWSLLHLAHAAWNCLSILELELTKKEAICPTLK